MKKAELISILQRVPKDYLVYVTADKYGLEFAPLQRMEVVIIDQGSCENFYTLTCSASEYGMSEEEWIQFKEEQPKNILAYGSYLQSDVRPHLTVELLLEGLGEYEGYEEDLYTASFDDWLYVGELTKVLHAVVDGEYVFDVDSSADRMGVTPEVWKEIRSRQKCIILCGNIS